MFIPVSSNPSKLAPNLCQNNTYIVLDFSFLLITASRESSKTCPLFWPSFTCQAPLPFCWHYLGHRPCTWLWRANIPNQLLGTKFKLKNVAYFWGEIAITLNQTYHRTQIEFIRSYGSWWVYKAQFDFSSMSGSDFIAAIQNFNFQKAEMFVSDIRPIFFIKWKLPNELEIDVH